MDPSPGPDPEDARLDEVVAEYLRAADRGEPPPREELIARHPELRDGLEAFFQDYERFHGLEEEARLRRSPLGGRRRVGEHEILEEIARGGMGVVYRARHVKLDRIVALKTVLGGRLAAAEDMARFRREARVLAALDHPRVVTIHDVGEEDGAPYFTMKLFEGGSLASPRRQLPRDPAFIAALVEKIARTVHAAHQQGVFHRDLKPANILLDLEGEPHVSDFGLARHDDGGASLTGAGQLVGTASYAAPEQASGRKGGATAAVDVYGLGAILYELLTGRPPFRGSSSLETLRQVITEEPPRPRALDDRVPLDLESICLRCLEKEPSARYASAAELADDLRRFVQGEPVAARPVGRLERSWRWCRRHPAPAAIGALLLAIAVGSTLGAVWLARARDAAVTNLAEARLAQATAVALSGRSGQRWRALAAVREAASTRRDLELRNAAVAALSATDLEVERQWPGAPLGTQSVVFDAGLERYARGDDRGRVSVRQVEGDRELGLLTGPGRKAFALRFSPDGRWLAVRYGDEGVDNELWIWDWAVADAVVRVPGRFTQVDIGGGGPLLAAMDAGGTLRLFSLPDGALRREIAVAGTHQRVRFAPGGALVAATSGTKVQIWDHERGERLAELDHRDAAFAIAWHPDGELLAVSAGVAVYIWPWRTAPADAPRAFRVSEAAGTQIAFAGDGSLLASASWDGALRLHSLGGAPLVGEERGRAWPQWSPDGGRLGYFRADNTIGLWKVARSDVLRSLHGAERYQAGLAWEPRGRWLAAAGRSGVVLWDAARGRQLARLPSGSTGSVLFPPGGRLLTCGREGLISWPYAETEAGGELEVRIGQPHPLGAGKLPTLERGALSADGRYLALRDGRRPALVLVDLEADAEGKVVREIDHFNLIWPGISRGGRWLAGGPLYGFEAKVWDAASGEEVWRLPAPVDNLTALPAFSPDGARLVISTDAECSVYRAGDWSLERRFPRTSFTEIPGPAAVGPDGRTLAVAMGQRLELRDLEGGAELATLRVREAALLQALAFSADGGALAAGTQDAIHVWDLRRLRADLGELGLDWGTPAPAAASGPPALRVRVVMGADRE